MAEVKSVMKGVSTEFTIKRIKPTKKTEE
jgi:hypothetical protein